MWKGVRSHARRLARAWRPAQPGRIEREPAYHRIDQSHLQVDRGLVAGDPCFTEALQCRTDVLVFELDRTAVAVDAGLKIAIVRGLVVGLARDIRSQHREVIRNDQVVLRICPWPVRHRARLASEKAIVISGIAGSAM